MRTLDSISEGDIFHAGNPFIEPDFAAIELIQKIA